MSASHRLTKIHRALLAIAGFMFVGTIGELIEVKPQAKGSSGLRGVSVDPARR